MNKRFLMLCSLALGLVFSSCGPGQEAVPTPTAPPTGTQTPTPIPTHTRIATEQAMAISLTEAPTLTAAPQTRLSVIFDDDGSPDGTTALLYLLSHPEVDVKAINISYGEAHPEIYIQHI